MNIICLLLGHDWSKWDKIREWAGYERDCFRCEKRVYISKKELIERRAKDKR